MGDETVTVKVLLFAKARELSGTEAGELKVNAYSTYGFLLAEIVKKFSLEQIRNNILLAINEEYQGPESPIRLKDGDEIAVIPPISGGIKPYVFVIYYLGFLNSTFFHFKIRLSSAGRAEMDFVKLSDTKLSVEEVCGLVSKSTCGAISLFVGTTKENFEDKKVIQLEYEAFEPMAVKSIKKICEDVRNRWKVENIAVHHRTGVVPVGEASVVIAVSSEHRAESLEAVRYTIDSLKASVPIWKKEVYEACPSAWKENQEYEFHFSPWLAYRLHGHSLKEHSYDTPEDQFFSYTMEETYIPAHLVQVKAGAEEIKSRIDKFVKRKREAINLANIRDFCQGADIGTRESTCARVDAILVPRKGSKSHLRVRKVHNKWGPQTKGLDPGSGETEKLHTVPTWEHKMGNTTQDSSSYHSIEGRLADAERYLNLTNKPIPRGVYERLKQIEDKILYLEGISPEYSTWERKQVTPPERDLVKLRKKTHTIMDLTLKIRELEKETAGNEETQ